MSWQEREIIADPSRSDAEMVNARQKELLPEKALKTSVSYNT